ncbi:Gaba permease [Aspergillus sclerotialis]|uniref:Gaba permease n=1 Tax=Aspergillus sclerotialis TaxID=2070753 RepID=A0A3A3A3P4_9EURO|nr:Gaba permease [Aspergillus sclerotialis]
MKDEHLQGDDAQLAAMGHKPELQRNYSTLSMLGLAFAVLNSWTALSASLSISITSGGSTSVIWALVGNIIGLLLPGQNGSQFSPGSLAGSIVQDG